MDPELWRRVRTLFQEACELPVGERARVLAAVAEEPEARAELERLLACHDAPDPALEPPTPTAFRALGVSTPLAPGRRLGPYEIVRVLGVGGMGTVHEAVDTKLGRRVALKTLSSPVVADAARRRFEYEGELLARLQHPGIAAIHDAGWVADRPYIVMEYVADARPLDRYVRDEGLDREALLAVFLQVADAVAYAHRRGVLHRDLKPSNLLVDADGRAKVIDFGIARTFGEATAGAGLTRTGELLGTLRYMSPEQLGGAEGDLDTRTDVWSLGVVLYELLCGSAPFDLTGLGLVGAAETLRSRIPEAPSRRARGIPPELDWIVRRALEPERDERYPGVEALAADLRRFVADEPVSAGPPSSLYRLRKLARRHRGLVAGLSIALVALVGGLVATGTTMLRALRAEAEAEASLHDLELEHARVSAVKELLERILASPHPGDAGRDVRVRDAVELALERADVQALLGRQPEIAGLVLATVGSIYSELGSYDEARDHLERALATLRSVLPDDHDDVLAAREALALTASRARAFDLAREQYELVLAARRADDGERDPATLAARVGLNVVAMREGRRDEAFESELRQLVASCADVLGQSADVTLTARNNLAWFVYDSGRLDEAIEGFEALLPDLRAVRGDGHPTTLTTMNNLAEGYLASGRLDRAEALAREVLAARIRILGEDHVETGASRKVLGLVLLEQGRASEADAHLSEALRIVEAAVGREDPRHAAVVNDLARVREALWGPAAAEELRRQNASALARVHGEGSPEALMGAYSYGLNLEKQLRFEDALVEYERILELAPDAFAPDDWRYGAFQLAKARILVGWGDHDGAAPLLESARAIFLATFGPDHEHTRIVEGLIRMR